ncbi:hypothetical protein D3C73_204830 [compost metagenome]
MKHAYLYTDTESNSGGGKLLSAAMVSNQGHRWYEAVELPEGTELEYWPRKHVIPLLGKSQLPREAVIESLKKFLCQFDRVTLVIDNNSDANHFAKLFEDAKAPCLIDMLFVRPLVGVKHISRVPHNALSDAYGLMEAVLGSTVVDHRGVSPRDVYGFLETNHIGLNVINSEFKTIDLTHNGDVIIEVCPVKSSNRTTVDRWTDSYNHAIGSIYLTHVLHHSGEQHAPLKFVN